MAQGYEYQHHTVSVRYRIIGAGQLLTTLNDLPNAPTQDLVDATITNTHYRPVSLLANFVSTKTQVYLRTTELGNYFHIKNITIFTKPIASGFPQ